MINKELLDILVCPQNQSRLSLAEEDLVARLNEAIAADRIENQGGHAVKEPIEGGLVREDQTLLYPIVDGIPMLLVDEAIPLEQIQ